MSAEDTFEVPTEPCATVVDLDYTLLVGRKMDGPHGFLDSSKRCLGLGLGSYEATRSLAYPQCSQPQVS